MLKECLKNKAYFIYLVAFLSSGPSFAATSSPSTEYLPLRGQADAFRTAAETASAFGLYMMSGKDTVNLKENAAKVTACVQNPDSCSQEDVFKALIQYNLNKEAEAMVIRNTTNATNLQTLDGHGIPVDNSFRDTKSNRKSYRVDIGQDFGSALAKDPKTIREQEILGKEFLTSYRQFVDAYSKPNEDNYVKVKQQFNPVTGQLESVIDTQNGVAQLDKAALDRDMRIQTNKANAEEVKKLEDSATAPKVITDSKDGQKYLASGFDQESLGFTATRLDNDTAKKYAQELNSSIDKGIEGQEKLRKIDKGGISEYTVDINGFNEFLNGIWPPAAGSPPK